MHDLKTKILELEKFLKEFKDLEKSFSFDDDNITSSSVADALDAALGGKHVNGRPYPSWLRSLSENSDIVSASMADAIKNYYLTIKTLLPGKKNTALSGANLDWIKENPDYTLIYNSIALFTGAHVASVRDPTKFDRLKATKNISKIADRLPTQNDYANAKSILTFLAQEKNFLGVEKLYRGISLHHSIIEKIKPGIEFQNWEISSWTVHKDIAYGFAYDEAQLGGGLRPVVLKIDRCEYGNSVSHASKFPGESEVVFGRRLKIKEAFMGEEGFEIRCELA
jgi:hypothetical protein